MDESRAERISELFEQALTLSPDRRASLLHELARREPRAHAELMALLASHAVAPDYLVTLAERLLPGALRGLSGAREAELAEGHSVGRYRILEKLGGGGMGVVYKALDPALNRPVALKFLSPHLGADPQARTRLIAEARAASALDHPNIAVVHEIGTLPAAADDSGQDQLFIAMGYYAGGTLRQNLAGGSLPIAEAVRYGAQLAAGLARAHEAGIVHRDIKPANLIITERGQLKIVDFGIAKLSEVEVTGEGLTPGTLAYMSPEQTRGDPVDRRTDIWSTGVVLYEMIAGVRPFRGEDDAVVVEAIRHDPAPPLRAARPEVPEALERVIDRCLRKDPRARYEDCGALRDDLEALMEASARGPRWGWRPADVVRGPRRVVAGVALAAAAAAAMLFLPASPQPGAVPTSASKILILPFLTPTNDTLLARLGRDLAITLSATLDGMGDIRTIDATTVFAHLPNTQAEAPLDADRRNDLARRLGAASVLVGSIVADGTAVRADARLIEVDGTDALARATASVPADSLGALTDSLALRLVYRIWRGGDMPVPSLGAVTTRSVPALRAYIDGEQALANGNMTGAVDAFESAFAADSSFRFAYWRSLYPRVYDGSRADTAVLGEVIRRRDELPERDRLLIEARLETTVTARQDALRALLDRYNAYWPAAWELANMHVHWTPQVGSTVADARAALERAVALNPRFAPAWNHLFMVAAFQGDAGRARTALQSFERLVDDRNVRWAVVLESFRTALEAVERDGDVTREREIAMAAMVRRSAEQVPGLSWGQAGMFTPYGFPAFQIRLNRRVLASRPTRAHASDLLMGTTMAWAARGAWDSVAVALDAWRRLSTDPRDALRAYGLGVLGIHLGGWNLERAEPLRRAAAEAAGAADPDDRAELAWLDGILAHPYGDTARLADARRRIQRSGATHADILDKSLAGFQQATLGDESAGARTLERIELDAAERYAAAAYAGRHPYLSAVNRLYASRWLLALGDTTAAARLLQWYQHAPATREGFRGSFATWAVLPLVLTEQARIATARGRTEEAADHRRRIIRLYDLPTSPQGAALLEEAKAALTTLPSG